MVQLKINTQINEYLDDGRMGVYILLPFFFVCLGEK